MDTRWWTTRNLSLNAPGPTSRCELDACPSHVFSITRETHRITSPSKCIGSRPSIPDASGSSVDLTSLCGHFLVARVAKMQHVAHPQDRAMSQTFSRLGVTKECPLRFLFLESRQTFSY